MSDPADKSNAGSRRRRGAFAAPAWAGEQRVGDTGAKAVLLILANYADEQASCYPGQDLLADETEQSTRQVARQLNYLETLGLFTRVRRVVDGKRSSDRFHLNLDVVVEVAADDPRRALLSGSSKRLPASLSPDNQTALPDSGDGSTCQSATGLHDTAGRGTPRNSQEELPGVKDGPPAEEPRGVAAARYWWEHQTPRPAGRGAWHSLRNACVAVGERGWEERAIWEALVRLERVPTVPMLDKELRSPTRPRGGQTRVHEQDAILQGMMARARGEDGLPPAKVDPAAEVRALLAGQQ